MYHDKKVKTLFSNPNSRQDSHASVHTGMRISSEVTPYFATAKPTQILYTPSVGSKIQKIEVATLEKELGFTWTESMMGPKHLIKDNQNDFEKMEIISKLNADACGISELEHNKVKQGFNLYVSEEKKIAESLKNSPPLILYKINEIDSHGVITPKFIKQGTVVGIYVGEYSSFDSITKKAKYNFMLEARMFTNANSTSITDNGAVDASRYRNFMAFINHCPENLDDYEFLSPVNSDNIATANLQPARSFYQGVEIIIFEAKRDILPGEVLGISYGKNYWQVLEEKPLLFATNGELIDQRWYQEKSETRPSTALSL